MSDLDDICIDPGASPKRSLSAVSAPAANEPPSDEVARAAIERATQLAAHVKPEALAVITRDQFVDALLCVAHGAFSLRDGCAIGSIIPGQGWGHPAAPGATPDAGKVFPVGHLSEASPHQQVGHGIGLIMAVLQHQPTACLQVGRCLRHDGAQVVEAVGSSHQRGQRQCARNARGAAA